MVGTPRQAVADIQRFARRRAAPIILELDLTSDLVEGVPADPLTAAVAHRRPSLREVVDGLRRAARDDRAKVLVAHIAAGGMPLARVQEVRDAVAEFRASGGVTFAYADTFGEFGGGTVAYYLACAFDEIWLAPPGDLGLTGVAMETPFLREALDRLGVSVEIGQRHEYKNAVNTLVERDFTPAHREALGRIVDSCAEQVVAEVSARRGLSPDQVRRMIDDAPMSGRAALEAGLVDRIGYRDEAYDQVRTRARELAGTSGVGSDADGDGGVEPTLMYVWAYRRAEVRREASPVRRARGLAAALPLPVLPGQSGSDRPRWRSGTGPAATPAAATPEAVAVAEKAAAAAAADGGAGAAAGGDPNVVPPEIDPRTSVVALVHGTGPVVLGSAALPFGGPVLAADAVTAAFRAAARDSSVAAAVFRVDSPGGSYVASDVVRREIERFRATGRPVIVSMGAVAASGGYFVALGGDLIVANPGTLTGSIGVFGGKQVVRDLLGKVGIGFGAVAAGENALMMSPRQSFTEAERAKLEEFLDRVYADFVAKVAQARRMSPAEAHELARGRVWTGADAHRHGLVDELGGLAHAIDLAWARAGLPAEETPRVRLTPKPSVLDRLRTPKSSEEPGAAAARTAASFGVPGIRGVLGVLTAFDVFGGLGALAGLGAVGGAHGGLSVGSDGFAGGWGALAPLAARAGLPVHGPLLMPPVGLVR
ncbi:signal peptidase [Frankia sp. CcI49]|uniref:signal peptide peptidase SppA n=1 Tax=Frankia sp. CcI49 TaxID=1745382 RepID=UPI00097745D9|nr:signal peptide peptidase SppA [Frankia sp. CcI49]ONH57961.1 signal peptidase [Frankia sp. CcI49]